MRRDALHETASDVFMFLFFFPIIVGLIKVIYFTFKIISASLSSISILGDYLYC